MSRVAVDPAPRFLASSGVSTGPSTPASIVSVSAPAGNNVLAGFNPPTARLWSSIPGMLNGFAAWNDAPSSRDLSSVT
jgi:hypothetical protein